MTEGSSPSIDEELIERLRYVGYLNSDNGDYGLRNPDGPAAADRLESLLSDRAKLTNTEIKALWVKHGGSQHGPHIEHYMIEEQAFYRFAKALIERASFTSAALKDEGA